MRIVHVETGNHLYGGAQQVLYLMEGLQARGLANILACTEGSAIAERARQIGVEVVAMPCNGDGDLEFMLRLRHLLRQRKPDLVHLHSRRGADSLGLIAARWAGIPVVLSRRVDNPEPAWFARLKYGQCRAVITISRAIRQVLLDEGVPSAKITCVHSAVRPERFQVQSSRTGFLDELELPDDARVIAVVAQLIERKNHIGLLRALAAIDARLPPHWKVVLFGQGPLQEKLANAAANLQLQDRIVFAGFRQNLPELIGHIDLLVHPALMEGLGVSLIEAAAAGVPMIGNPAGGIPEILRNDQNGLLVDCTDPEALGAAIIRLAEDATLRREMGQRGRAIVAADFSVDAMVQGNLAVYRQLANNP